jgi:hypothetical protein
MEYNNKKNDVIIQESLMHKTLQTMKKKICNNNNMRLMQLLSTAAKKQ